MTDRAIDEIGITGRRFDHGGKKGETEEHGILPITCIAAMKPIHGGDLGTIRRRFPEAPLPWLDLSTGINPIAYPVETQPAETWTRLPSRNDEEALCAAVALQFGVRDPATIVAAPGTQALIQLLPRILFGARVAIMGHTYEEHEI